MYTKAQLRRIDACVSACEGLSTEELKRGLVQDMLDALEMTNHVIDRLRNIGDETDAQCAETDGLIQDIESVLARVKGGE